MTITYMTLLSGCVVTLNAVGTGKYRKELHGHSQAGWLPWIELIQERIAWTFIGWLVTLDRIDTGKNCMDIHRLVGYLGHN